MMRRTHGRRLFAVGLALALAAVGCPAVRAEEGGLGETGVIRPGGIGTLQRIEEETVVIDDRSYALIPSTQYRAGDGASIGREGLGAGDRVLFERHSGTEILLLWKLQ